MVGSFSQTVERSQVIDFSMPVRTNYMGLLIPKTSGREPNFLAYLIIFTPEVWVATSLVIMALAASYLFRRKQLDSESIHKESDSESLGLTNSLAIAIMALMQLEYPVTLEKQSTRILHLTTCGFALLIFSFYTADLTSRLTAVSSPVEFSSLDEALDLGYKILATKGTVWEEVYSLARDGTGYKRVWDEVLSQNPEYLIKDRSEGRKIMRSSSDKNAMTVGATSNEELKE